MFFNFIPKNKNISRKVCKGRREKCGEKWRIKGKLKFEFIWFLNESSWEECKINRKWRESWINLQSEAYFIYFVNVIYIYVYVYLFLWLWDLMFRYYLYWNLIFLIVFILFLNVIFEIYVVWFLGLIIQRMMIEYYYYMAGWLAVAAGSS